MTDQPARDDDALADELGELMRKVDAVPAAVLEAARNAFTWRTVDAELAALSYDSLVDGGALTRSADDGPRLLTFVADRIEIEIEVDEDRSGRRLLGQISPPAPAELVLRSDHGSATGSADELGRFVLALTTTPQRITLRCTFADGADVESASVVV